MGSIPVGGTSALPDIGTIGRFQPAQDSALKSLTLALLATLTLTLGACSKNDTPTAAAPVQGVTMLSLDQVAATGKGFSAGSVMSTQTAYVLFDPQCPHCGHLWQASLPLHNRVKFVWVPVAFSKGKSVAQAAALLTATDPVQAMTAHEESLLKGTGGMAASADIPADLVKAIERNTQLLTTMGVDSVPFLISKHRTSGQLVSQTGAMDTATLSTLLGLN